MPTPRGYASYMVDLGLKADGADIADGDIVNVAGIVPFDGTIKEIWAGVGKTLPTTVTLQVAKGASTNISLLTGGTALALGAFTVNVATSATLTSGVGDLKVTAGNMLIATYTMTAITEADDTAFCCVVIIEPNVW